MSGAGRRLGLGDGGGMTGPGRRGREAGRPGGREAGRPGARKAPGRATGGLRKVVAVQRVRVSDLDYRMISPPVLSRAAVNRAVASAQLTTLHQALT